MNSSILGFSNILSSTMRKSNRKCLPSDIVHHMVQSDFDSRAKYFFNEVAEHQEIWTIWDDGVLPEYYTQEGTLVIYCWPHEQFARNFYSSVLSDPIAVPIPINDWVDDILLSLPEKCHLGVFPINNNPMLVMDQSEFVEKLFFQYHRIVGNHPEFDHANPEQSVLRIWRKAQKKNIRSKPMGQLP